MSLTATVERIDLQLARPFTIARGTATETENLIVEITDEHGTVGIGGAAPTGHYGETTATAEAVMPALFEVVERFDTPEPVEAIEAAMLEVVRDNPAARCAISIALHDLIGKRHDLSVHRLWGLQSESVDTSFTIGIDPPEVMAEYAAEAVDAGYDILKIKLGAGEDETRIAAVREAAPDATLRVDANEGWGPKEAVRMAHVLAEHDVEFLEQPVPAEHPTGLAYVAERSPLPIAADESCITLDDIPAIAGVADIANIKLMKCGGLLEARRMIHAARAHGMEVMLGCMAESNASIAAGAQLGPMLEYADLDGSLLLADDPYDGPVHHGGAIAPDPTVPGIGVDAV